MAKSILCNRNFIALNFQTYFPIIHLIILMISFGRSKIFVELLERREIIEIIDLTKKHLKKAKRKAKG